MTTSALTPKRRRTARGPRGVFYVIPVGLIARVFVAMVRLVVQMIAGFFGVMFHGTVAERVYVLLLLCAPIAGFKSVRLAQRLTGNAPWLALSSRPSANERAAAPAPVRPAAAPVPAGPPPNKWVTASADGAAELRQEPTASGCRVKCVREGNEVWDVEGECQGSAADLRFVANDCILSTTFFARPAAAAHRRFIDVFRLGRLERLVLDLGLTADPVALRASHLISGMGGNPGAPPTYSADGDAVAFSVISGGATSVPLVAAPAASAPKRTPARKKR